MGFGLFVLLIAGTLIVAWTFGRLDCWRDCRSTKANFDRLGVVTEEDLEWCRFLLMNAETAAINFVKRGSS